MKKKDIKPSPLSRLLTYSGKYQGLIWQAIACSVFNKIFDLAPPALIGAAVDVVVNRQRSLIARLGISDAYEQLLFLTFLSAVIWSLESLFEYAYERLWRNLAQNVQHDLRIEAYSHLQDLELKMIF